MIKYLQIRKQAKCSRLCKPINDHFITDSYALDHTAFSPHVMKVNGDHSWPWILYPLSLCDFLVFYPFKKNLRHDFG